MDEITAEWIEQGSEFCPVGVAAHGLLYLGL
jgi:hypothetical protein